MVVRIMGSRGDGVDRPYCDRDGCGRRAYVEGEDALLCHVCDSILLNQRMSQSEQNLLGCSPARQSRAPLQDFLQNPALAKLCMEFLHGDGWERQCLCTHCKHSWLDAGWVCPIEIRKRMYLQKLDELFVERGYFNFELIYVDWHEAVRCFHDVYTGEIQLDFRILEEFAHVSRTQLVTEELREMYPDGDEIPED